MAHAIRLTDVMANARADATVALLSNGWLRLYDGIKPATAATAITTQVLLAELRFGTPAAGAAVEGLVTFNAITSDSSANASGTPTWCRMFKADGTTVVMDGTVGTANCDVNLGAATIIAAAAVPLASLVMLERKE